jgi:hypothetical protein
LGWTAVADMAVVSPAVVSPVGLMWILKCRRGFG